MKTIPNHQWVGKRIKDGDMYVVTVLVQVTANLAVEIAVRCEEISKRAGLLVTDNSTHEHWILLLTMPSDCKKYLYPSTVRVFWHERRARA